MNTSRLWALVLVLASALPATASAQLLGRASAAVHGGGSGGGGGGGGGYRGGGYGGRGYGGRGYGYYGGGQVYVAPWITLGFPYYAGYGGVRVRESRASADRPVTNTAVLGIVDVSLGYVFDGVVRGNVAARVRFDGVVDVGARYGVYLEGVGSVVHALGVGELFATFQAVEEEAVQLRVGAGGLLYHDVFGTELGFEGRMELDAYPIQPLVIRAEAAVGMLGQAAMIDGRASIGVQIDRGEIYVGYQVLALSPGQPAGVALHGPVIGACVWIS